METVLITGANRGLGYELLKVYSTKQYISFPLVRTEETAEQLMNTFPKNCYPIVADLNYDDAKECIANIVSKHVDSIDVLINNAGISGKEFLIETVSTEEVNNLFNIHCLAPIRTVQACIPFLRNSDNPRIINVSSRLGSLTRMASGEFINRDFSYSYRMAKAAQNMFTISLSQELQMDNITVCAVHPGQLITRGGSTDSDTDAMIGATNMYEWIETINIINTGSFVQPLVSNQPW